MVVMLFLVPEERSNHDVVIDHPFMHSIFTYIYINKNMSIMSSHTIFTLTKIPTLSFHS